MDVDGGEEKKSEDNQNEPVMITQPTTPQDKKKAILAKKQSQWEYLCSSYVFYVRHKDPSQFNKAMASIGAFNLLIKEGGAVYRTFTIIDDDTPLDDGCGDAIILDRCRQKFDTYSSSLKYLIQSQAFTLPSPFFFFRFLVFLFNYARSRSGITTKKTQVIRGAWKWRRK